MTTISAKERVVLAGIAGVHEQYLYQCLTGKRDMDATEAAKAERVTDGRLRRWMLRRDWAETWPELTKHPDAPAASRAH